MQLCAPGCAGGRGQGLLGSADNPGGAWRAQGREGRSLGLRPTLGQQDTRENLSARLGRVPWSRGTDARGARLSLPEAAVGGAPRRAAASARAPQAQRGRARLPPAPAAPLRRRQLFTAPRPGRGGGSATRAAHRAALAGSGLPVGGAGGRAGAERGGGVGGLMMKKPPASRLLN